MGWMTMMMPIMMKMLGGLFGGAGGRGGGEGSQSSQDRSPIGELVHAREDTTEYPGDYRRRKKRGYGRLNLFNADDELYDWS